MTLTKNKLIRMISLMTLLVFTVTALNLVAAEQNKDKILSKGEVKNLIANAKTKADHERIARYFDAEAAKYDSDAKEHGELAPLYEKNTPQNPTKFPGSQQTSQHCDSLSKSLQKAAEDARALAAHHREMAKEAKN